MLLPAVAAAADWSTLQSYQQTITRDHFTELLENVYAPSGGSVDYLRYETNAVMIFSTATQTGAPLLKLEFAATSETAKPPGSPFKDIAAVQALNNPTNAPLHGLRIVLDPGHIGGAWARVEERYLKIEKNDWPVQEAALNLFVAHLVKAKLEAAGATVLMTRDGYEPVTTNRPEDFVKEAEAQMGKFMPFDGLPMEFRQAARADSLRRRQELMFYRSAEISARAEKVNGELKPDLTLCLHFNAVDTDDRLELVDENGLAVFVHGNYLADELRSDDQKFCLFNKLLDGSHDVEMTVAKCIVAAFQKTTALPPAYTAKGGTMYPVDTNHYVYARNLAANRLYCGPVVFLEPYYMNNRTVYHRIQAGDYDGTREFEGASYRSIFRDYADAVAEGVIEAYRATKNGDP